MNLLLTDTRVVQSIVTLRCNHPTLGRYSAVPVQKVAYAQTTYRADTLDRVGNFVTRYAPYCS